MAFAERLRQLRKEKHMTLEELGNAIGVGRATVYKYEHGVIRNIQMDERLSCRDTFDVDLTVLDPVIYSGKYHSLGKLLGSIGDFL